ncbi:hypothetical protein [Jutongia sp.]
MREYVTPEDYDSFCKIHLQRNQKFLQIFTKDIENRSPKLQEQHINNLATFLNDYLVQRISVPMEEGIRQVNDYFGYFLQRKGMCSGEELRLEAATVKKFYKSMTLYGFVEAEEYKHLCNMIIDCMEEWIQECIYAD